MLNKRGQITIFIIIGILLLSSIALFLYFRANIIREPEIIESEFLPIKKYTEDCLSLTASEAITTLALNGGYITFPDIIEKNPRSYIQSGPIKDFKIPFWWYNGRENIPTEEFMADQIGTYIQDNINLCLKNYVDFEQDYSVKSAYQPRITIELTDEAVVVQAKYPLVISQKLNQTKTKISQFSTVVPIRLKKVYGLAKNIMEKENNEAFIEEKTIDLMSMDRKIPTTDFAVSCSKKTWYLPEIRERLKKLLAVNLPYIKIKGTDINGFSYVPNPFVEDEIYEESYYNYHYIWDIGEQTYKDMHVSFSYDPSDPINLYARPNKGQKLQSNTQKSQVEFSFICLQMWHFTYDVEFPVKVTIKDEKTKDHDELLFNFAFKASIDHNQANRKIFASNTFKTDDQITDDEFCAQQKNIISINTEDDSNSEPINDVNLTFAC